MGSTSDSLQAKVSEIINVDNGQLIIREKWNLFAKQIVRSDAAKIENYGIINVGF